MAIAVTFSRERAQYILECLARGAAIRPEKAEGWTRADVLAVAGALLFVVLDQEATVRHGADWSKVPGERQEARADGIRREVQLAMEWHALAVSLVRSGEYDQRFEPRHRAVIVASGTGRKITPIEGFKGAAGGGEAGA